MSMPSPDAAMGTSPMVNASSPSSSSSYSVDPQQQQQQQQGHHQLMLQQQMFPNQQIIHAQYAGLAAAASASSSSSSLPDVNGSATTPPFASIGSPNIFPLPMEANIEQSEGRKSFFFL